MLTTVGLLFAILNGSNDGGALVASSLKAPGIRPAAAVAVLGAALGAVPVLLGLRVAETLAGGLVPASADQQGALLIVAVLSSLVVVVLLNVLGLPTSLTLAVIGGLVGAGVAARLPVAWGVVGATALAGIAAPVLGGVLAWLVRRSPFLVSRRHFAPQPLRRAHAAAFGLQAVAYAANDGQKIYAVLAAGALAASQAEGLARASGVEGWQLVAAPVLFALGAVLGVRRAARTLGSGGILRTRPRDEVAAELSSALAVLASAGAGMPVSMTQSVAGSLIGAGMTRGYRRVRWRAASRLAMAWVLTLPASVAVGAGAAVAAGLPR